MILIIIGYHTIDLNPFYGSNNVYSDFSDLYLVLGNIVKGEFVEVDTLLSYF